MKRPQNTESVPAFPYWKTGSPAATWALVHVAENMACHDRLTGNALTCADTISPPGEDVAAPVDLVWHSPDRSTRCAIESPLHQPAYLAKDLSRVAETNYESDVRSAKRARLPDQSRFRGLQDQ
jgi:hypothetical protein